MATEDKIRALVQSNPRQLSYEEYKRIADCLATYPDGARFLSFSTGRDVKLWLDINAKGVNVFCEHDQKWVDFTQAENPAAAVYKVAYKTRLDGDWYDGDLRIDGFPESLANEAWDVVFVDGPPGYNPSTPGRFQSIWQASKLNASHVFVHDCNRIVEQTCCNKWLAPKYPNKVAFDRTWHYFA